MTYEDHFNPTVDNDVNDDGHKKTVDDIKSKDKYYEKFTKPLNMKWSDGKFYKRVTIELWGSGPAGSRIRNAVNGHATPYIVGSRFEDLFFTVCDSTGHHGRKEPLFLFYDSPEQYENHQFTSVSLETKNRWYEKHLTARKGL
jgi:hypothetical protein